jgi:acyl-homoserine-lactone acylase
MRRRTNWKRILALMVLVLLAAAAYLFWPQSVDLAHLATVGDQYDVRILRDSWGVPHVFGATDADVAYGLAYAHAEDDFLTIQQSLLAARGDLAAVYGPDLAPADYMVHLLRIWDTVEETYETMRPETRALLEAYADGLNHYAALHPAEVLTEDAFPATGRDIAAAAVHKVPFFFGLDRTLVELFSDSRQKEVSARPSAQIGVIGLPAGSNTLSVGPARTADGSTYLAVNSHQPWEGPETWYEAHVHSEEGWDMAGALFPGAPVVIHGHNRNLGWAFTVNHADLVDVYVLTIHPDNPDQYLYDGEWLELEVRTAPIRVKLLGRLVWTVKEEVLWSVYGPVVRRDHGTYAVRYAGAGRADLWEQLYRMNKATDLAEWQAAVTTGAIPTFNIGYADREGNIYYLYNGALPVRAEGYDWSLYLPGDTSETLWTDYLAYDRLPQVLNPPSGFVQNCNSSPFQTTLGEGNPDLEDYSPTLGIEDPMTNRALRALALLGADDAITFEEFTEIKYDRQYAPDSGVARYREMIVAASAPADPGIQPAIEILKGWDLRADPESSGAALMVLTLHYLDEAGYNALPSAEEAAEVPLSALLESLSQAAELLEEKYGRLDVPWSEVNRLRRGQVDLGVGGGPDVLNAIYGRLEEDGRFRGVAGDSYVMLVAWDAEGRVRSYSIHQYGSATLDESSPHFADQSPLFVRRELKPVWMEEADIRANLEEEYRPGEEMGP